MNAFQAALVEAGLANSEDAVEQDPNIRAIRFLHSDSHHFVAELLEAAGYRPVLVDYQMGMDPRVRTMQVNRFGNSRDGNWVEIVCADCNEAQELFARIASEEWAKKLAKEHALLSGTKEVVREVVLCDYRKGTRMEHNIGGF